MDNRHSHKTALAKSLIAAVLAVSLIGGAGITLLGTAHVAAATTSTGTAIVNAAASQAGIPYCEGGGGILGPSLPAHPFQPCSGGPGYDCMSLAQFAVFQATGITVPYGSGASLPGSGTFVPPDGTADLQPGDVVFFGGVSFDAYAHSGVYAGNDEVWDALSVGTNVQEHAFGLLANDYQNVYWGAVRYANSIVVPTTTTTTTTAASLTPSFAISTSSLASGTVSSRAHPVTYQQSVSASGGRSPYKWSVVKGSLPSGLHLKPLTGVISGKAKTAGSFSFTVKVVDTKTKARPPTQDSATKSLVITIKPAA